MKTLFSKKILLFDSQDVSKVCHVRKNNEKMYINVLKHSKNSRFVKNCS